MSDELKPCPHCGSNDYVAVEGTVSSNNFQVVCNWLFGGCGASSGARRTQAEAIEVWNTRADDAPISERIVPSLKEPTEDTPVLTDSRERLEDDLEKLRKKWKEFDGNYMRIYSYVAYSQIINLLDRQASITEREVGHDLMKAGRMAVEVERERIAELTAECNGLKARVKFLQSQIDASHFSFKTVNEEYGKLDCKNDQLKAEIAKYEHDCGLLFDEKRKLTAERDQLSRDLTAEHALVAQFEHDNEQLREAIDAMENGQFYAMYRRACEERERMQRVIDTQRESSKKMEADLHALNSGETLNTLRASVAGLKDTVEKQKAEIERLKDENAELNMQVHGAPF